MRDSQDVDLTSVDGSVELDFDALEPVTLWKLYEYTQRAEQTANGVTGTFRWGGPGLSH